MSQIDETDFPPQGSVDQPGTGEARKPWSGPPAGMRRGDENGWEMIDAMAGRASVFGFGYPPITQAIERLAHGYLGDASSFLSGCNRKGEDSQLRTELMQLLGDSRSIAAESILLCASADMAVERAISLARTCRPDKSFRTIAIAGADHGRTAMCRTASGRPELHEGFGPMMAGFTHVPVGDLDSIKAAVDEQTACVLISPLDLHNAARPCDADYLMGLRQVCDEHEILLVVDESQLTFGSSGSPLAFHSIAEIRADIVALAAGLFAGLPGGLVLASQRVTGQPLANEADYPLQAAVAQETLSSMLAQGLPASATDSLHAFAVALAESLSAFEFVRDANVLGITVGLELDIESKDVVQAAAAHGLRIEMSGDIGIRIQPPLVSSEEDRQLLLLRLRQTMETIERAAADMSL